MSAYSSKDVGTIAYLLLQEGATLRAHTGEVPVRSVYMTVDLPKHDEDELRKLISEFINMQASVEPQAFLQKQAIVKQFIFSVKGKN